MNELNNIKEILKGDNVEEAILKLQDYIKINDKDDAAYYMLGNAYQRLGDWRNSIKNYCEAIEINPQSPAKEAYRNAQEVLNFYNHDLYNP